jgi:hypothetical protein
MKDDQDTFESFLVFVVSSHRLTPQAALNPYSSSRRRSLAAVLAA